MLSRTDVFMGSIQCLKWQINGKIQMKLARIKKKMMNSNNTASIGKNCNPARELEILGSPQQEPSSKNKIRAKLFRFMTNISIILIQVKKVIQMSNIS